MRARPVACARSTSSTPASDAARSVSAPPANGMPGSCGGNSYRRATRPCGTSCCGCRGGQGMTMCGRFTQNYTWEEVYAFLKVFGTPRNLRPHYNIAPTTNVDVIRLDREGRRELVSMRWGLVPGNVLASLSVVF